MLTDEDLSNEERFTVLEAAHKAMTDRMETLAAEHAQTAQHFRDASERINGTIRDMADVTRTMGSVSRAIDGLRKEVSSLRDWVYAFHPQPRKTCPSCGKQSLSLGSKCAHCGRVL